MGYREKKTRRRVKKSINFALSMVTIEFKNMKYTKDHSEMLSSSLKQIHSADDGIRHTHTHTRTDSFGQAQESQWALDASMGDNW